MHFMEKLRPLTLLLLRVGLAWFSCTTDIRNSGAAGSSISTNSSTSRIFPLISSTLPGALELGGGALLVFGLFTRLLGLLLAGEMAVALWKDEKFFQHPLAIETYGLALVLGVGAFALATFGAGSISLDRLFFGKGKSSRAAKSKGLSNVFCRICRLRRSKFVL